MIFLAAHMENRSFEIIPHEARVQPSRQRPFGKTRNETTKNRIQHDQGSLNKQSACSVFFLVLHWLFIKGASGEIPTASLKMIIQGLSREIA